MSSAKCPHCGLVNFADAVSCKRCHEPLASHASPNQSSSQPPPQPVFYTVPPPPVAAAPSDADYHFDSIVRRDGKFLVVTEDSVLPDRCVRCNAAASKQVKRSLQWVPGYVRLAGVLSIWLTLILYVYKSETATVYVGLCDSHHLRRQVGMFLGGGLIALGLLMGMIAALTQDFWFLAYGGISLFLGVCLTTLLTQTVTVKKMEGSYIWLKGVSRDYLNVVGADMTTVPPR
jgi:hypothetical protein